MNWKTPFHPLKKLSVPSIGLPLLASAFSMLEFFSLVFGLLERVVKLPRVERALKLRQSCWLAGTLGHSLVFVRWRLRGLEVVTSMEPLKCCTHLAFSVAKLLLAMVSAWFSEVCSSLRKWETKDTLQCWIPFKFAMGHGWVVCSSYPPCVEKSFGRLPFSPLWELHFR